MWFLMRLNLLRSVSLASDLSYYLAFLSLSPLSSDILYRPLTFTRGSLIHFHLAPSHILVLVFILTQTDWCEQGSNASYCAGPLLQLVQLSEIYGDSKTFSDKPTRLGVNQTFEAFGELPQNATYGEVLQFAEEYFVSLVLRVFLFLSATPVFLCFLPIALLSALQLPVLY
jgi:hypothetical protein